MEPIDNLEKIQREMEEQIGQMGQVEQQLIKLIDDDEPQGDQQTEQKDSQEIKNIEEEKVSSKVSDSNVETIKISKDTETQNQPSIDPQLDLEKAMEELLIDPKAPDFNEEDMIEKFKELRDDTSLHHFERDRYEKLIKILQPHKFWDNQPIMLARKKMTKFGQIQKFKVQDIPKEPLTLPQGFEWSTIDINDDKQCLEVIEFLEKHYVEDQVGNFRLKYSIEKYRWGARTPGYISDMHFLIRSSKDGKIMGNIVGVPKKIVICGQTIKIAEINFLAVHAKLRGKSMAKVIIEEMMRRKRINGFPQAYYTSGHVLPTPFSTTHYMNRFINVKKLVDIQYTHRNPNIPMKEMERQYKLSNQNSINIQGTIREMQKKDVPEVFKLYHMQQKNYKVYYKLTQDEIIHYLMPQADVVWTYVIVSEKGQITDFFSMYRLTQTCTSKEQLGHKWDDMHSGCLYYYGLSKNTLEDVIKKALWIAKEEMNCDAFSAMTLMDNQKEMFMKLNFLPGDGALHWYFVNWSLGNNEIGSNDIGTILI